MRENRVINEIYTRLKSFSGRLYPVVHRSVQEGVARGFQAAKEKAGEEKRKPDVTAVDDTEEQR